jgi:hypothetical protein
MRHIRFLAAHETRTPRHRGTILIPVDAAHQRQVTMHIRFKDTGLIAAAQFARRPFVCGAALVMIR